MSNYILHPMCTIFTFKKNQSTQNKILESFRGYSNDTKLLTYENYSKEIFFRSCLAKLTSCKNLTTPSFLKRWFQQHDAASDVIP